MFQYFILKIPSRRIVYYKKILKCYLISCPRFCSLEKEKKKGLKNFNISENNIINIEAAKGEMFYFLKIKIKLKLKKNIFVSLTTIIHKNIQPNLAIGQI